MKRSHTNTNSWIRPLRAAAACLTLLPIASFTAAPANAASVPGELIVGYDRGVTPAGQDRIASLAGTAPAEQVAPTSQVVRLRPGESTAQALRRLRSADGVAYAVPNRIARAAAVTPWKPNDIGRIGRAAGGWLVSQWNFSSAAGVDAMTAWANLNEAGRPGGSGVKIAVIDSGVAYTNWGRFRRSPDFVGTRFSDPYDFVSHNRFPLDRNGHGTHVAGTIAEATNNRIAMTGLAWGATIMPLRVLDAVGNGDSAAIARAIRYAASKGAKVINLSIEFDTRTRASDIPDVIGAINYATGRGALVVAASGNDAASAVTYPARTPNALAVGATTEHGCLADYSNYGVGLDIVAPGGGLDRAIRGDSRCQPESSSGRDVVQLGLRRRADGSATVPYVFEIDAEDGTSMAAPHVSAAAALVIASGTVGANPSPGQVRARLESTASPRGSSTHYGAGMLDAGRATSGDS